jgi:L-lactate permease
MMARTACAVLSLILAMPGIIAYTGMASERSNHPRAQATTMLQIGRKQSQFPLFSTTIGFLWNSFS